MKKIFLFFLNYILLIFLVVFPVQASNSSNLLPNFFSNLLYAGTGRSGDFGSSRTGVALLLVLALIIILAVFYAFTAGWKYVRSQGDQAKIDESTKAINAVFLGLGALLVSISGIVLVFAFFGNNFFGHPLYASCDQEVKSASCLACRAGDGGLPANWEELKLVEKNPEQAAGDLASKGASWGPGSKITSQQICIFCEYQYFQYNENGKAITQLCLN